MKSAVAATITVAAGLFAANMLGVAVAEAPTTATPLRTISVQGTATLPIGQGDNAAATLGAVQSVAEGGGYINCTGAPESAYAEYEGEQPDFGSAAQPRAVVPLAASKPTNAAARRKRAKSKHPRAKKAAAVSCTLTAQVALIYAIS